MFDLQFPALKLHENYGYADDSGTNFDSASIGGGGEGFKLIISSTILSNAPAPKMQTSLTCVQ